MKKLLFLFVPVLFTACSPRVTSSILRQQPAAPEDQTVEVFNSKEQITSDYEILGTISVDDTGFTTHCDSLLMISLAKQEVRKIGGNGFLITEHKRPSFWTSSCHRFKGVALNMSDLMSAGATNDADFDKSVVASVKQRNLPRFTFSANVGPAWRTAKLDSGLDEVSRSIYKELKSGTQIDFSADYYFNDNYGIRLGFQRFFSSHTEPDIYFTNSQTGEFLGISDIKGKDAITAIFPAFLTRFGTNNQKWLFDLSLGIGYIHYSEKADALNYQELFSEETGSTVCFQISAGVEYLLTKNLGIAFNLNLTSATLTETTLKNNDGTSKRKYPNDKPLGIGYFSPLLGLRYHIK